MSKQNLQVLKDRTDILKEEIAFMNEKKKNSSKRLKQFIDCSIECKEDLLQILNKEINIMVINYTLQ